VGEDGDEISTRLGVIIAFQADGMPVMFGWVVFHIRSSRIIGTPPTGRPLYDAVGVRRGGDVAEVRRMVANVRAQRVAGIVCDAGGAQWVMG
jgi:hypothetical protein